MASVTIVTVTRGNYRKVLQSSQERSKRNGRKEARWGAKIQRKLEGWKGPERNSRPWLVNGRIPDGGRSYSPSLYDPPQVMFLFILCLFLCV